VPGGVYAQLSNIGSFYRTDTSVIPELTLTLGYQVLPHTRVLVGYTLLGWTNVMRAGDQIDRHLDVSQVPTFTPFAPGTVGAAPTFPATRTGFWAQGVNLGLEFRF
jgi:hypothetical protein